ncbi:uncharacterized protein LOC121994983 [Zingiber officinale]|uniref:uncharacterized protein LOC121994983 n=1 Tax=Zingiber officinale TaxID=94328 RepID=UPI001C4B9B2A|nr:uncharacterized protein LOC121994983 [Zingiber officinale]
MKTSIVACLFDQWGMDIVGPFPMAMGQRKFLLVTVDYFSKWKLKEWYEGYDIQQAFTSVAYPQSNRQVEVANREILRILRIRLDHVGGSWVDELPSVLWVIHTTSKEGTGATPFHLVYGSEAVVPVEVGVEFDRIQHYNEDNAERRLLELGLVGDLVWKKVKPVGNVTKLEAQWGRPFKVVEKLRLSAYYLEDEDGRRLE